MPFCIYQIKNTGNVNLVRIWGRKNIYILMITAKMGEVHTYHDPANPLRGLRNSQTSTHTRSFAAFCNTEKFTQLKHSTDKYIVTMYLYTEIQVNQNEQIIITHTNTYKIKKNNDRKKIRMYVNLLDQLHLTRCNIIH